MPEQPPVAQQIAERYNLLKGREAIQWWRKNVPADVRNIWMREFAETVGQSKLTRDYHLFRSIIEQHLPQHLKREYFQLLNRIPHEQGRRPGDPAQRGNAEEVDLTVQPEFGMREFLHAHLNSAMREEFSRQYFLSFDTDDVRGKAFFAEQQERITTFACAFQTMIDDSRWPIAEILSGATAHVGDHPGHDGLPPPGASPDRGSHLACIVVCGSSAIGPRLDNAYASVHGQDLDLMIIPHGSTAESPALQRVGNAINAFGLQVDLIQHGQRGPSERTIIKALQRRCPDLYTACVNGNKQLLDIHAPLIHPWDIMESWRSLTGPHRVAYTFRPDWQQSYQWRLDQYVNAARQWGL
ncbi:hypothetical protein HZA86_02625 [Candidatus Uhrbacteria bacterium]|nr:hypothetical protein [Candidatus Uhrbacteria bacterium]